MKSTYVKKFHQRNNELYSGLKCKHTASENWYKYRKRSQTKLKYVNVVKIENAIIET